MCLLWYGGGGEASAGPVPDNCMGEAIKRMSLISPPRVTQGKQDWTKSKTPLHNADVLVYLCCEDADSTPESAAMPIDTGHAIKQ